MADVFGFLLLQRACTQCSVLLLLRRSRHLSRVCVCMCICVRVCVLLEDQARSGQPAMFGSCGRPALSLQHRTWT